MKKRVSVFLTLMLLVGIGYTVNAANSSQYLRSRLTVFSAQLYQEINNTLDESTDYYYAIGIVPIIDVNSNNPQLVTYLFKRMEESLSTFPGLRLAGEAEVLKAWDEAKKLPEDKRFQKMGEKLGVSGIILTSLVAHQTYYSINATVFSTKNGKHSDVTPTYLERSSIDSITADEMKAFVETFALAGNIVGSNKAATAGTATAGTQSQTGTASGNKASTGTQQSGSQAQTGTQSPTNTPQPGTQTQASASKNQAGASKSAGTSTGSTTTPTQPALPTSATDSISSASQSTQTTPGGTNGTSTQPSSEGANQSNNEGAVGGVNPGEPVKLALKLQGQSVMMSSLLFGFDLGDVNGDGMDELVYYAGGSNIQVRNLNNYAINYTYSKYMPTIKDYKILAIDIDGDGRDEVITHGYLLKVENNNLVTKQNRFISRPVSPYKDSGLNLFNQNSIFTVNYQGLVSRKYAIQGTAKRFIFADVDGGGDDELISVMEGEDENAEVRVYKVNGQTLHDPITLSNRFGYAVYTLDLNHNGLMEIYLKRNYFSGDKFLYSKIYVYEYDNGTYNLLTESQKLDCYIVDFSVFPKDNPSKLVVGTMNLKNKKQDPKEVKSRLLFYTLE